MNPVYKKKMNDAEVAAFIAAQTPESKIYLGCDSECYKKDGIWYAYYTSVVVVHINGNRGCKIFGEIVFERLYEQKKNRPSHRLMSEAYKVSELYLRLEDIFGDREVEIHLDLNPNKKYVSSLVVDQAIGYVRGTCNIVPMIKPKAFSASYAADRYAEIVQFQKKKAV